MTDPARSIFHIVAEPDWQAAGERGSYAPPSLAADGFVHFSYRHQVAATANRFYSGLNGLIVLEVDPARLPVSVVEEDLYGAGELFPHVYSAIEPATVIAVHPLSRDTAGDYRFEA